MTEASGRPPLHKKLLVVAGCQIPPAVQDLLSVKDAQPAT